MAFVTDTFTDVDGTTLASHVGELGAAWSVHPNGVGTCSIKANHCVGDGVNITRYFASGVPGSADYTVQTDLTFSTLENNDYAGVWARLATATNDGIQGVYYQGDAALEIRKTVSGVQTIIGSQAFTPVLGTTRTLLLSVVGTALKLFLDGVQQISITDGSITAAGRPGLTTRYGTALFIGIYLDNFSAVNASGVATHVGPYAGKLVVVMDIVAEWSTGILGALLRRRRQLRWRNR